jgi:hypothetical protein
LSWSPPDGTPLSTRINYEFQGSLNAFLHAQVRPSGGSRPSCGSGGRAYAMGVWDEPEDTLDAGHGGWVRSTASELDALTVDAPGLAPLRAGGRGVVTGGRDDRVP